jgi:hypothetical protein
LLQEHFEGKLGVVGDAVAPALPAKAAVVVVVGAAAAAAAAAALAAAAAAAAGPAAPAAVDRAGAAARAGLRGGWVGAALVVEKAEGGPVVWLWGRVENRRGTSTVSRGGLFSLLPETGCMRSACA